MDAWVFNGGSVFEAPTGDISEYAENNPDAIVFVAELVPVEI